ncbi:MAG: lytic transglycosylase, partial [Christiangramia sp.]|nr:lytic transglycosylase [Christiangramia sp.]
MLKIKFSMLLLLVGISVLAQEKKNKERVEKANFRVQIFQKSDDTEIQLAQPDPEFKDKLPISAAIRDSSKVKLQDLPRAKTIDSLWKLELTNSDLYEMMQKE